VSASNVYVAAPVGADQAPETPLELAARLSLPWGPAITHSDGGYHFLLFYQDGCLSLQQSEDRAASPLCVDFEDGTLTYRQRHATQPEAILKAIGARHSERLRVVDATAGWGLDAFVIAAAGHRVDLFERSTILHALLQDGLHRAAASQDARVVETARRMTLHLGDSGLLASSNLDALPDVIYLDPMFPERRKSAKVKKNMFLLQRLLQDEVPSATLLRDTLPLARRRVVVKRSLHAGFLEELKPSFQLSGKSSRFDIYLTQNTSLV
jgi:16S rRNA (guanine1516-N2)-methyltransferase